jgi:uncharacterized protein
MIYLDANVLIRLLEGTPAVRTAVANRLAPTKGVAASWATSRLSRLECRCKPLAQNDSAVLGVYDQFFSGRETVLLDVSSAVIDKATELRARFGFKTPDSIHVASAIIAGTSVFLTGDKDLARCPHANVEIL